MDAATDAQLDLIGKLAAGLRIRNLNPRDESLTKAGARELIDQLRLRQVSQRINRPVTVHLSDAAAVRRELERVTALDTQRPSASKQRTPMSGDVRIRHVDPQPRRELTATEELARRASLDRGDIGPYATGRFSEATGYGSHAAYTAQTAATLGEHDETPVLTDPQERYIIDLQDRKRDTKNVAATIRQAGAEIDRLKDAPGPVTRRQAAYLTDLQLRAGEKVMPAADRDAASAEITRLRTVVTGTAGPSLTPAEAASASAAAPDHTLTAGR